MHDLIGERNVLVGKNNKLYAKVLFAEKALKSFATQAELITRAEAFDTKGLTY